MIKSQVGFVVLCIACLLVLTTVYAQMENPIDTLTYFADQNVDLGGLVFTDVDSLGVYFTPDTTWSKYDLLEFHLLLSPYIYGSGDSSFSGKLYVHSNKLSKRPGSVLQSIYFSFQGSKDIYPNWKIINLRDSTATKLLENDFWLLGLDLGATVVSETNSGHTFLHSSFIWQRWDSMRYDFAVKAIIQQNRPTSVGDESSEIVNTDNSLHHNYPNPFNQETIIRFFLNEPTPVTIDIFDVSGRLVRRLIRSDILQGQQAVLWDGKDSRGRDISSGVYFYRLRLRHENIITRKMLLIQ